jgi:hypothetical protein
LRISSTKRWASEAAMGIFCDDCSCSAIMMMKWN